jgi:hypothetical protein
VAEATTGGKSSGRFLVLLAAVVGGALCLAASSIDAPGLYYDEAVQARPAKEFLTGVVYASPFSGSRTVSVAGRPFPWMTQPYMGALKSQALIPSLWIFGSSAAVLRLTTLCWALLAVVGIGLFARRCLGERTALVACLLLAFDPSLLLLARHDWGSFALSLLLRSAVMGFAWRWWETGRGPFLFAAALAAGLGLFNKVDFSIFLAAAGLGILACGARPLLRRVTEHPRQLGIAAGGFLLGLLPMLPSLASVLAARSAFAQEGEAGEKLRTLVTMLDGSYFQRLLELGGLFDRMQEATQWQPSLLAGAFALALVAASVLLLRKPVSAAAADARPAGLFLLVASLAALLAYFALPGAVRIHHALNVYPFPHLLIAWVLSRLGTVGPRASVAALGLAALVAGSGVASYAHTIAFANETGGRGRWSAALDEFAVGLQGEPIIVSLDWGFHESVGFLTEGPRLMEAYPRIPAALAQRGAWTVEGSPRHVYLLHEQPYDLFGYGGPFLAAVARLAPKTVAVERHLDRQGQPAFTSVRILVPHRVVLRSSGFEIQLL